MRVVGIKENPNRPPPCNVDLLGGPEALLPLLERSDFVSLHTPLTDATRRMIDATALSSMKPGAALVNVARADLVNRAALFEALDRQRLAAAAFDTLWDEPASPNDPVFSHPRFFASPHVAGFTEGTVDRIITKIAENVARLASGSPLEDVVNPAALDASETNGSDVAL
jgi:phosphoglycerate dehydrogenase-like enzyme